jgi:pyruvate/2-oxoglutarate dehydrogenase complex dihydrolipoamide dehydrogenase (E3) component
MVNGTWYSDLCIIGGGSAGLSIAAGAAQMGASVTLIEQGKMGGDCLNTGCVPSKALLAAAKQAQTLRTGAKFGISNVEPAISFDTVMAHVNEVISQIAPHDSQERFESLGVRVVRGHAKFLDRKTVDAAGIRVQAKRFVIATGSRPVVPHIKGLSEVPYLTNETIFENQELPEHLLIIGAGPIGMELSQAFRRLGSKVTVLDSSRPLKKEDLEVSKVVIDALKAEGVEVLSDAKISLISRNNKTFSVELQDGRVLHGSHLLVAAGRRPNFENLELEQAHVATANGAILVDRRLRSKTNNRVFVVGDASGGPQYTHVAGYHAGVVIKNALFLLPSKTNYESVPRITYTDPELAHVGMSETQAKEFLKENSRILKVGFSDNDRAVAEGRTEGFLKVITNSKGRIYGASIVGQSAGELILPWVQAIEKKQNIKIFTQVIAAYPTRSEISKSAAHEFFKPKIYSPKIRWIVRMLLGKKYFVI